MAHLRHSLIMSKIKVRINGRGNAWPVVLGQEHPFYDRQNYQDLANASFSIIHSNANQPNKNEIEWELMIDAGHGAVQYLLKNCNRIPEVVFITHPHIDHTLGLDWIVQSYYKTYKKQYPVYATMLCWEYVKATFPQLEKMIYFKELVPFESKKVEEAEGVEVLPLPAYHGKSAFGASMLYFNVNSGQKSRKMLFTGDLLCPLLREQDYQVLTGLDLLITDANNRFPYPWSNHWSIINGPNDENSKYLQKFIDDCTIGLLLEPHLNYKATDNYARCFDYFLNQTISIETFQFTIHSFIKRINPRKVLLTHYSGVEDQNHYNEQILNDKSLENWANNTIQQRAKRTQFVVPYVSQHM